jgi:hypothetical protein
MFADGRVLVFILLQLCAGLSMATMEAVTKDGRHVRLLDDQTWEFIDGETAAATEADPTETIEPRITIEITQKQELHGNCVYGLRLQNDANFQIVSLVPQFTAHVAGDVKYETVFQGFQRIKPTRSQFQKLTFSRVKCDEITRILVHGGDRCAMNELTKYSTEKGECLKHVRVIPSPLVSIAK